MNRLLSLLWHDVYLRHPSESGFSGPGADRYKLATAEFDAQLEALAMVRQDRPVVVSDLPNGTWGGVPIAITFDDGGVSYYTIIAERLEERGWRGHCLVTTGCIGRPGFLDRRQIRELHDRGHLIGTHSVSHPGRFASCTRAQMAREWTDSKKVLEDILGDSVTVGSVPGGYFSPRVAKAASEAGLDLLFTSEPETRLRDAGGCMTAGRFTIRQGRGAEFARRLGALDQSALFREWAVWNTKKVLKAFLGAAYPRVTAWAGRVNR